MVRYAQRQRLQGVVAEIEENVGPGYHEDGRPINFAKLDDECIELGGLPHCGGVSTSRRSVAGAMEFKQSIKD